MLFVAPAPPAAGALGALDVGGGDAARRSTTCAVDLVDRSRRARGRTWRARCTSPRGARRAPCASASAARSRAAGRRPHAPSIRRAGACLPAAAWSSSVHRIGAEPGEQRHVVGAHDGADRIDLQQAEPRQHAGRGDGGVMGPAGRGSPKPWAASAMRRASRSETVSFMRASTCCLRGPICAGQRRPSTRLRVDADRTRQDVKLSVYMKVFMADAAPVKSGRERRKVPLFRQGLTCFAGWPALTLAAMQHGRAVHPRACESVASKASESMLCSGRRDTKESSEAWTRFSAHIFRS